MKRFRLQGPGFRGIIPVNIPTLKNQFVMHPLESLLYFYCNTVDDIKPALP